MCVGTVPLLAPLRTAHCPVFPPSFALVAAARRFFEITDAAGQKTHLQNLLVADPANATFVPSELANGTLVCPQGEGLVNATYAASFE